MINNLTLLEAGESAGCCATLAAEERKYVANDTKCHKLVSICELFDAWGVKLLKLSPSWPQDSPP